MKGYLKVLDNGGGVKCGAINRNCAEKLKDRPGEKCKYKFKKGETVCPQCGALRRKCNQWATKGAVRCRYHGGLNKKHRKYDDYGLPVNYFKPEELVVMRKNIDEGKKHESMVYEVAAAVFRRLVDQAEERDQPDMFVFQVACEYFQKIVAGMKAAEKQPDQIHVHKFDEVGAAMYEERLQRFAGDMVKRVLLVVFDVIKGEPDGNKLIGKMRAVLPASVTNLLGKQEEEKREEPVAK